MASVLVRVFRRGIGIAIHDCPKAAREAVTNVRAPPTKLWYWSSQSFPQFMAAVPKKIRFNQSQVQKRPSDAFGLHRPTGYGW